MNRIVSALLILIVLGFGMKQLLHTKKRSIFTEEFKNISNTDEYHATRECILSFYQTRLRNDTEGILYSYIVQPKKYILKWDTPKVDERIMNELSKLKEPFEAHHFMESGRSYNNNDKSLSIEVAEGLAQIAMSTKMFSACKEYVLAASNECIKPGTQAVNSCFRKKMRLYQFHVSHFIVSNANDKLVDMSKIPILTPEIEKNLYEILDR